MTLTKDRDGTQAAYVGMGDKLHEHSAFLFVSSLLSYWRMFALAILTVAGSVVIRHVRARVGRCLLSTLRYCEAAQRVHFALRATQFSFEAHAVHGIILFSSPM